jgi:hypothetical protein
MVQKRSSEFDRFMDNLAPITKENNGLNEQYLSSIFIYLL